MNKILLAAVAIIFFAAGCSNKNMPTSELQKMKIGEHVLEVEIADSQDERDDGLSNRKSLPENQGMLFEFETPGIYPFWMKDTKIPLDFIWIRDGKVAEIMVNVPIEPGVSDASLKRYSPSQPVDSMLEVNAGFAVKKGIKVGDSAALTK